MARLRLEESGFTIVEVLVAALILSIAAMTTFGLLSSATRNTERAKATQVALDRAQQEVEKLRSLSNQELAMTVIPAHGSSDLSPAYRVNSGAGTFALIRTPTTGYEQMVVNGGSLYGGGSVAGGVVNPGPISFTSGTVKGKVYRYVVWRNDEKCPETKCPGTQDYKQIVVAVKLDKVPSQQAERGYVEVQSSFVDPKDSALKDPIPGAEGVVTAQQFFLSDTPCAASGATDRQDITGEHLLHNTRGACSNGLKNGTEIGAPDALLLGGPPDPAPEDSTIPAEFDYSNDFYLEPTPDTDKGLQLRRDDTSGCHYTPTGTTNPQAQVHRWVTDPMAAAFKLGGTVTLKLFSQTIGGGTAGSTYKAGICIYLYKRHETISPAKVEDTMFANKVGGLPYWTYSPTGVGNWPKGGWGEISVPMALSTAPYTIPVGDRLGVAVTLDPAKTSVGADGIAIMYDFPGLASRLEVETPTPIEAG